MLVLFSPCLWNQTVPAQTYYSWNFSFPPKASSWANINLFPHHVNFSYACWINSSLQRRSHTVLSICSLNSKAYLYKFQFQILWHVVGLTHTEHNTNYILGWVAQLPQIGHDFVRLVYVTHYTVLEHVLYQQRMWLITNLRNSCRITATVQWPLA